MGVSVLIDKAQFQGYAGTIWNVLREILRDQLKIDILSSLKNDIISGYNGLMRLFTLTLHIKLHSTHIIFCEIGDRKLQNILRQFLTLRIPCRRA